MDEATVRRCIRLYGLEPHAVHPMLSGYRNESYPLELSNGRVVNLILFKREARMLERIRRTNELMCYLHQKGLPVRYPIDQRIMQIRSGGVTRYAALYNFLPGRTIPWEAYTMEHLKLLGQSLAHLHRAMRPHSTAQFQTVTDEYSAIFQQMDGYFFRLDVAEALSAKLQIIVPRQALHDAADILAACRKAPAQQLLHMDFVRSNILFSTSQLHVMGILDFEKAAVGTPLLDIARTLAFLLVDCKYKSEAKVRKYFLQSGYQKRGGVRIALRNNVQHAALERCINFFLLHDFYKFLRHNPYESLADNEHYVRTRDILLSRDVITTTARGLQD